MSGAHPPATDRKVYAHLCTWFKTPAWSGRWEMWESSFEPTPHDPDRIRYNGQRDIAAVDYPLTDVYDSSDPDLIDFQLLSMKRSGFDGVVVDWDGRRLNAYRHEGMMALLPRLERFGMKLMVCFEEWCGYWPEGHYPDREAEVEAARAEAQWLMDTIAGQGLYAEVRGVKPVLVFRKKPKLNFTAEQWRRIREPLDAAGGAVVFPPDAEDALDAVGDGRFFWVGGFEPEHRFGSLEGVKGRNAAFLESAPKRACRTDPPLVLASAV